MSGRTSLHRDARSVFGHRRTPNDHAAGVRAASTRFPIRIVMIDCRGDVEAASLLVQRGDPRRV
ncbi:hypothetical protein GCG21_12050 [Pseudactinotalea sp. HY160]|uniref:hypothetical protein n=1 Tax=Pseudactinotalea sp. HY160 TaxID=2654490 RepID=UPI00128B7A5D|nr:hypothetical protein [Pseudactinotalea sp. HY160]MPV50725.1 hypothetical protein [Pseudactinotalea sp. HY160]